MTEMDAQRAATIGFLIVVGFVALMWAVAALTLWGLRVGSRADTRELPVVEDIPHAAGWASLDDRHHADPYTGETCTMPDCQRWECVPC